MKYKATIGMEIHVELKTATKMFCSSRNDPNETRPNVNICPVCMAHPGTLPTINKEAVRQVLRVGYAVGGTIADYTEFDRKNYFYPDIPKGYQLSQYQYPLVSGGALNGVTLTRIHLEEDTASSVHSSGADGASLVDYNRAGVPLMELVTEPCIHSGTEASAFAKELQLLLRTLGASEANMEKGEMRLEANVSVAPDGATTLGTKVEIKNLNSFRSVERAVTFEIERQTRSLESGEEVSQETRGWDETRGVTFAQRSKEYSHDYRYFPDPDLPKLRISAITEFSDLHSTLPELPWERRARLQALGLKVEDVELLITDGELGGFFDAVVRELGGSPDLLHLAINYCTSDLVGLRSQLEHVTLPDPTQFAELMRMLGEGALSSRGAKEVLLLLLKEGGVVRSLAATHSLLQVSDEALLIPVVERVLTAHPEVLEEFRGGKGSALQFLIGMAMKEMKGSANPQVLAQLFRARI